MALNANILSTIVTFLGIRNLHIHFDANNERIDASYEQYGQHHERKITFREIEELFSDRDSMRPAGPGSAANSGGGS